MTKHDPQDLALALRKHSMDLVRRFPLGTGVPAAAPSPRSPRATVGFLKVTQLCSYRGSRHIFTSSPPRDCRVSFLSVEVPYTPSQTGSLWSAHNPVLVAKLLQSYADTYRLGTFGYPSLRPFSARFGPPWLPLSPRKEEPTTLT